MESATFLKQAQISADIEADILAGRIDEYSVLTGDRPTGPLHIGHYFGTLQNRVRLQDLGVSTTLIIADYQVLTDRDSSQRIREFVGELAIDYMAAGIDPDRTAIFTHSSIPALNQLLLPFLSLVTTAELERNPTVKDEMASAGIKSANGLMFVYPVHQAADILFSGANLVPVGRDQLPHLELTRQIANRFNRRFSPDAPVFRAPHALLSETPLLLGLDGMKMSKSRGNTIPLRATSDETVQLVRKAKTDSERHISFNPVERPDVANLLTLAALAEGSSPSQIAHEIGDGGSGELKRRVAESLNEHLRPIRARRTELEQSRDYVMDVIRKGNQKMTEVAESKLDEVRKAMGMSYFHRHHRQHCGSAR